MASEFERTRAVIAGRQVTVTSWFDSSISAWRAGAPMYSHLLRELLNGAAGSTSRVNAVQEVIRALTLELKGSVASGPSIDAMAIGSSRLFIAGLPFDVSAGVLEKMLSRYGKVSKVDIPLDRATGEARGIAFVDMDREADLLGAVKGLNGSLMDGRKLTVETAHLERPSARTR